ncbi:hypothetical protein FB446DRAFT_733506 [Lentinula raphanica]|nr:hypothetical protein FB446DRAFT_733506 [Lentinula raphanica]
MNIAGNHRVSSFVNGCTERKRKMDIKTVQEIQSLRNPPSNLEDSVEVVMTPGDSFVSKESKHFQWVLEQDNSTIMNDQLGCKAFMTSLYFFPLASLFWAQGPQTTHLIYHFLFDPKPWPHGFVLPCRTPDMQEHELMKFIPRSSNCLWRGFEPLWIAEVYSPNAKDQWERLLLEGSALVRLFSSNDSRRVFVLPAIYIDQDYQAQILFMYQSQKEVHYHQKRYNLAFQNDAYAFLVALYNISDRPSILSKYGEILSGILQEISYRGTLDFQRQGDDDGSEGNRDRHHEESEDNHGEKSSNKKRPHPDAGDEGGREGGPGRGRPGH